MQTQKKTGHKVVLAALLLLGVGDLLLLNLVVAPRYIQQRQAEASAATARPAEPKGDKTRPAADEASKTEPAGTKVAAVEPAKPRTKVAAVEPVKAPPKPEPARAEPVKAPPKPEPARAEPVKAPPKPEPARVEPAPVKAPPPPLPAVADIRFITGSSGLFGHSHRSLDRVAKLMAARAGQRVFVHGHADERGTPETNHRLSLQRATSVAQYLVSRGVSRGRIKVRAHGADKPLDRSNTAEAWGKNRRVEIKWK